MKKCNSKNDLNTDIEAVITSYNQGTMISSSRLFGWENEMIHSIKNNQELSESSNAFMKTPTYGDGGMASAVRIVSSGK